LSLLLDTHVLLWWLEDDRRLSPAADTAIERKAASVLVSAASIWEIEVKRLKGKLTAPVDLLDRIETLGFRLLDLTPDNMLDAARLPRHHGDPFDRFLVAQAQAEAATLVSDDAALAAYDVPIMRASARA
jgi:PIN domain nuclease of toxin-antitoxin system